MVRTEFELGEMDPLCGLKGSTPGEQALAGNLPRTPFGYVEDTRVKRPRVGPLNLANILTGFRIAAVPLIIYLMCADWGAPGLAGDYGKLWALLLTFLASVTDYIDGVVARMQKLETKLGKFLDPVADKLLVCSVFTVYVADGTVEPWILITMIWREFLVLGLRMHMASEGQVLGASHWAKFKTIFQMASTVGMLLVQSLQVVALSGMATVPWVTLVYFHQLTRSVILISVLVSLASGLEYFINHWEVLKRG